MMFLHRHYKTMGNIINPYIFAQSIPINPSLYLPLKTDIQDLSANGFVGTKVNSPTFNNGLVLNGINQYVNFGNILNIGINSFCLSIQFKTTTKKSVMGFIGKTIASPTAGRYGLYNDNNSILSLLHSSVGGVLSSQTDYLPYLDNNWHTLTMNVNRSASMDLLVDGILMSSKSVAATAGIDLQTTGNFFVGCYGDSTGAIPYANSYFNGALRNAFMYQRLLNNTELSQLSKLN